MNTKVLASLSGLLLSALFAHSQGTNFTYQGRLLDNGAPANGAYDLRFILRDAPTGGSTLGVNILSAVNTSNGLFTVSLDFGTGVFDGAPRWLEIAARKNGSGAGYATLAPNQLLTPSPYALVALNSVFPPGSIIAYMGTNPPTGWLLCDGAAVSRTEHPRLFAIIGTSSGAGDGTTTFNLPDLRGRFPRGLDGTAGVDPDRATRTAAKPGGNTGNALGSSQADQFTSHTHANGNFNRVLQVTGNNTITATDNVGGTEPDLINAPPMTLQGGNETRPKNIYVNYLIKL